MSQVPGVVQLHCPICRAKLSVPVAATAHPIQCGVCRQMFRAPPLPAQPPQPAIMPPHLAATGGASANPNQPGQRASPQTAAATSQRSSPPLVADPEAAKSDEDRDAEDAAARSRWLGTVALLGLSLVVLTLVCGVVVAVKGLPSFLIPQAKVDEDLLIDPESVAESAPSEYLPALWAMAPRVAIIHSDVLVRVKRVEYGEVLGRTERNEGVSASGGDYLIVYFQVENRRDADLDYISWYGNTFRDGETTTAARLSDAAGKRYSQVTFDSVRTVKGHMARTIIAPRDRIDDVLVFGVPREVIEKLDQPLKLELPRSAIDSSLKGSYRFQIPRRMLSES